MYNHRAAITNATSNDMSTQKCEKKGKRWTFDYVFDAHGAVYHKQQATSILTFVWIACPYLEHAKT